VVTAHLYEEQIFTGECAVAQACCQAVLQSSTEQWGMHFALTSFAPTALRCAALQHWFWQSASL
jgi:hypothetical protein